MNWKSPKGSLVLGMIAIWAWILNACSHNPLNIPNLENQANNTYPTTLPTISSPKQINPLTAKKLTESKQLSQSNSTSFVWLPNGRGILVASRDDLGLFRLTTSKTFGSAAKIPADTPGLISASRSSGNIAWVGSDKIIHLWNVDTQISSMLSLETGDREITGLSFSPVSNLLAHADVGQKLTVWDPQTQQKIGSWQTPGWLTELTFSPDEKRIAGAALISSSITILDTQTGQITAYIKWGEPSSPVLYKAVISPDWQSVAWVSRGIVQITGISGEITGPMLLHEDYISDVAWSPDGRILATASAATIDGNFTPVVQLWDANSGVLLKTLSQAASVLALDFSPDGYELGVLCADGVLKIWIVQE